MMIRARRMAIGIAISLSSCRGIVGCGGWRGVVARYAGGGVVLLVLPTDL